MKILVACEESQAVTKAFRSLGHEAYSCDIQECSGGKPQWHIQGDAIKEAYSGKYDMMIAHPPCTFMSKAGARFMYPTAGNVCPDRLKLGLEAQEFFIKLLNAPIKHIVVENPTPLKVVRLPKETQVIQPYQFGHPYSKRTLLWIKNLPPLEHTDVIDKWTPFLPSNTGGKKRGQKTNRGTSRNAKESSKTFQGIANAMAEQWSEYYQKNQLTIF
tara:strand:+ start:500 stop:1144 length:645 start_codon:yes stop_codon:yes gene_type:complete